MAGDELVDHMLVSTEVCCISFFFAFFAYQVVCCAGLCTALEKSTL